MSVVGAIEPSLRDAEIERVKLGPTGPWAAEDAVLLQAVDDLFENSVVSDATWSPGDDFCTVWHFFDLLPEGPAGWWPKINYP